MSQSVVERFWSKVDLPGTPEGCWIWRAGRTRKGYGLFADTHGHSEHAHRVAWRLEGNEIPKGGMVLHHCDNPSCVRPEHLFVGSAKDNIQDAISKGRIDPFAIARVTCRLAEAITHCPHGHAYVAENMQNGRRNCKTCGREAFRRSYQKNPEKYRARARHYRAKRKLERGKP